MDKEEFLKLATKYEDETMFSSSMNPDFPSFKKIVAAKEEAIPYIIEKFERRAYSMHWVYVLMVITNESPIQPKIGDGYVGWNVEDTCKAWIKWYRAKQ